MGATVTAPDSSTPTVEVKSIVSKGNLRRDLGDLSELVASIAAVGLIEPLVVAANGKGYDLLAGHRRFEAVKSLKWKTVPVHVIDISASDADVARLAVQLVENLQRHDLDPVEEAQGYAQLLAFGWKQVDIAKRVGRSEGHVSKRLSLLELPDRALDLHDSGRVGSESLYELTKVVSAGGNLDPILDHLAATDVEDTTHPTEEVEHLVRGAVRTASAQSELDARVAELEAEGTTVLGAKYDPAQPNNVTLPKHEINSWSGSLAGITPDNHAGEPCHAVCVYISWDSVRESYHCTDHRRHLADGASKLKVKKGSSKDDGEKAKESAHRELVKTMFAAASEIMDGRAPARDTVLQQMMVLYLRSLGSDVRKRAISLLDLTAEISGDTYQAIEKLYSEADATSRHKILLAAVLADGHVRCSSFHLYDDVRDDQLAFLADLGHPVPNVTITGARL